MLFTSKLSLILPFVFVASAANTAVLSTGAVIPVSGLSVSGLSMGAITLDTGETRLYYQNSTTEINVIGTTNAFDMGEFEATSQLIPAGQARAQTPLAVLGITDGASWSQIRIVFFSPQNVLSEWVWTPATNYLGGPACTVCVTNEGFVGVPDSQLLYVIENSGIIRIGFVSAGEPNTFSEAVFSGSGWSVAPLTS